MRAIVQRVMRAGVSVGEETISSIGQGLCVLVGIHRDDTQQDMEYMVRKILRLRVFEDENGKRWMKNVMEKRYDLLCVSQFTLYCDLKGNKPDYRFAMGGEQSEKFYNEFLTQLKKSYASDKVQDGKFAAYMQVNIQNDGPVTITLDSPAKAAQGASIVKDKKGNVVKNVYDMTDNSKKALDTTEAEKDITEDMEKMKAS